MQAGPRKSFAIRYGNLVTGQQNVSGTRAVVPGEAFGHMAKAQLETMRNNAVSPELQASTVERAGITELGEIETGHGRRQPHPTNWRPCCTNWPGTDP